MIEKLRFFLLPLLLPLSLFSKDFGICGNTLPVREENLKEVMAKKASKLPQSIQKILKDKAKHPRSISLKEATQERRFSYVPRCVAPETIKDLDGEVIIEKGASVNPLDTLVPPEGLLFFDGDNPLHIAWAKDQKGSFDWVLTKGNPLEIEEKENRLVYFDQGGKLVLEFGIEAIPAKIIPIPGKLLIEEIPIKKKELSCR